MRPRFKNVVGLLCLFGATGAYALESMDDTSMADTSGQAGITVTANLQTGTTAGVGYTDRNGFTNFTTAGGDIYLRRFSFPLSFTAVLDVGAASAAATTAALQVSVALPSALTMTFNTNSSTGLGVGVMDFCQTPASGFCAYGSANDYAVMMAPTTGVTFTLGSTNLKLIYLGDTSGSTHTAVLTDTAASTLTITGSQTTPNIALVDPGSVTTVGTTIGGAGAKTITVSGLEFGSAASQSASTSVTFDICSTTATTVCPVAKTGGNAGLLVNVGSGAMTNVSVVASGVAIGNVGTGSTNNGLGTVALTNLNLANTSVMIYPH